MHKSLTADIERLEGIPHRQAEAELHKRHKTLAYSYPNLFFKTVRGEMDQHIFDSMMDLKEKVDSGEINNKRAKELVIDGAKRHIEGEAPRAPKAEEKEGGTVQEITLKCKVEEANNS